MPFASEARLIVGTEAILWAMLGAGLWLVAEGWCRARTVAIQGDSGGIEVMRLRVRSDDVAR